jgi:predicted negative regulator of RcsB-dependent stress response
MPKVIKKRETKPGRSDETLMDTVDDIRSRIKSQQKTLAIALIIAVVVLVAAAGIYMYSRSQDHKAASLQVDAYKAFNVAVSQPSQAADNYKKALDLFKKSYDEKGKADTLLLVAYCQYGLGNYDEAITTLKQLTSKFKDPGITPLAYYKLSEAYLKKGDQANALETLSAIEGLKGAYGDLALMQTARILEQQGKGSEAKTKYNELVTKYPASAFVAEAKQKTGQK